jgi:tRNA (guanine-N7-)-methyltransferase
MLGMEIRLQVSEYIRDRIKMYRSQSSCQNVAVVRTNAMKFLPNYFRKGQLSKLFFLFPDPHFKEKKHKWRIISHTLLAEYAYVLREGGFLYTVTDVCELYDWILAHVAVHPLFEQIDPESDLFKQDPVIYHVMESTEEAKKVSRQQGTKYIAVFRRRPYQNKSSFIHG